MEVSERSENSVRLPFVVGLSAALLAFRDIDPHVVAGVSLGVAAALPL